MLNKYIIYTPVIIFLVLVLSNNYFWTSIGLAYTVYVILDFTNRIGKEIPIPQLMLLIAAIQWILAPWFDYITPETHYLYHMYINEYAYMKFIVPGLLLMHLGISIFYKRTSFEDLKYNIIKVISLFPTLPYIIIGISIFLSFIGSFLPASLQFVVYLLINIKYIGALYLFLGQKKNRWLIFVLIMSLSLITSIATGMFHDFLLWAILSFTFISYELNIKYFSKITIVFIGMLFTISLQDIKPQYRNLMKESKIKESKTDLFFHLLFEEWKDGTIFNKKKQNTINIRFNQGWIISRIMWYIPSQKPFTNGTTIKEAINATLIPRFLNPNKAVAGGRKNFQALTGLKLEKGTSMGISLAGEGWANFGYWGGILFLFSWGLLIGWFWKFLITKSITTYSTLLVWSPLIFQQVIKAETELLDVLNHLVKATILVFLILWLLKKQFNVSL